jgi:hypothetical protein
VYRSPRLEEERFVGFASEYLFVLKMLCGFAAAGGFVVLPFRRSLRFGLLVAPFAGLLGVTLGIAAFYGVGGLTVRHAMIVSWSACVATTAVSLALCRPKIRWPDLAGLIGCIAIGAAIVTRTTDATTIRLREPALLYSDGTDHLGYAQVADWLNAHSVKESPEATPRSPSNWWLTVVFRIDPRFGSFFLLAMIAQIRSVSATWAYDVACAICLSAAILGVTGAFARKWGSLLFLICGLLLCAWFDDSRIGYLGKLIAYPAAIMIAGLFIHRSRTRPLESTATLVLLVSATALCHSGMVTAMFLGVILGPYLLARAIGSRAGWSAGAAELWRDCLTLAVLIGTAVIATGIPARPVNVDAPDFGLTWAYILPRSVDLEHPGANIQNIPQDLLPPLVIGRENKLVSGWDVQTLRRVARASWAIWICLAGVALLRRDPVASALLIGPVLLLIGLWWRNLAPQAFQLLGFIYPCAVCGSAWLLDGFDWKVERSSYRGLAVATAILATVFIGMRLPRYRGCVRRYAGSRMPRSQQLSLSHTDRLVQAIGNEPVEVNITSLTHLLFVVIELGHREGVQLQWSRYSFEEAFPAIPWKEPDHPPAKRRLIVAGTNVPPGWRISFRAYPYFLITAP